MLKKSITKITMEYEGEIITRYFQNMDNFKYLYPTAKILKDEYINNVTQEKELEKIYKENNIFG